MTECVYIANKKCKSNKAPGADNLGNEFYKNITTKWVRYILNMFNEIFTQGIITPIAWSPMQLTLLYKKGANITHSIIETYLVSVKFLLK